MVWRSLVDDLAPQIFFTVRKSTVAGFLYGEDFQQTFELIGLDDFF